MQNNRLFKPKVASIPKTNAKTAHLHWQEKKSYKCISPKAYECKHPKYKHEVVLFQICQLSIGLLKLSQLGLSHWLDETKVVQIQGFQYTDYR